MKMPEAKSRRQSTPMIMRLPPSAIIHAINLALAQEGRPPIPVSAELSVKVPGGGDWSNTDLGLDEGDLLLDIRWEQDA